METAIFADDGAAVAADHEMLGAHPVQGANLAGLQRLALGHGDECILAFGQGDGLESSGVMPQNTFAQFTFA